LKKLIFFYGPALDGSCAPLDGAGTILDEATRPVLIFTFLAAGFFDTSAFHLSLAA
jgi:hypothetical protein